MHVQFEDGVYFLNKTEEFSHVDSGSFPDAVVSYESAPGATPVISGGLSISRNHWVPAGADGVWKTTLPEGTLPFEQMWVGGDKGRGGARRYPAHPDFRNEDGGPWLYMLGPVLAQTEEGAKLACNGHYLRRGTGGGYQCLDRLYVSNDDIGAGKSCGPQRNQQCNVDTTWSGWNDPSHPLEIVAFANWTLSRMRLKAIDINGAATQGVSNRPPNSSTLTLVGDAQGTGWGFIPGHRFLIQNVKEALVGGETGQWYLDTTVQPNELYYRPAAGERFTEHSAPQVIVPQLVTLIKSDDAAGLHDLRFAGLTFSHANWIAGSPGFSTTSLSQQLREFNNGTKQLVTAALSFSYASHLTFMRDVFTENGGYALDFLGQDPGYRSPTDGHACSVPTPQDCNLVIDKNTFSDQGSGSIRIGQFGTRTDTPENVPQQNLVSRNLFFSGDRVTPGVNLFIGNSNNTVIDHNTIYDFFSYAIAIGHSLNFDGCGGTPHCGVQNLTHDNHVTNNLVFNIGEGMSSDLGAVHMATGLALGNTIENNIFHDIVQGVNSMKVHQAKPAVQYGYGGWAIYIDQGSSFVKVDGNLVYNTSGSAFQYNSSNPAEGSHWADLGESNPIFNNIFAFGSTATLHRDNDDGSMGDGNKKPVNLVATRNIFYWDNAEAAVRQGFTTFSSPLYGMWTCDGSNTDLWPCFHLAQNMYYATATTNTTAGARCETGPDALHWCFFGGEQRNPKKPTTPYSLKEWQALGEDLHSIVNVDPGFDDPAHYNFHLSAGAAALKPPPEGIGFQNLCFTTAACTVGVQGDLPQQLPSPYPSNPWPFPF